MEHIYNTNFKKIFLAIIALIIIFILLQQFNITRGRKSCNCTEEINLEDIDLSDSEE